MLFLRLSKLIYNALVHIYIHRLYSSSQYLIVEKNIFGKGNDTVFHFLSCKFQIILCFSCVLDNKLCLSRPCSCIQKEQDLLCISSILQDIFSETLFYATSQLDQLEFHCKTYLGKDYRCKLIFKTLKLLSPTICF